VDEEQRDPTRAEPSVRGTLSHSLTPDLDKLARIRSRRRLHASEHYRARRAEIEEVLNGFEWDLHPPWLKSARSFADRVRIVAWNIERGKHFEPLVATLTGDRGLAGADVLLLNEVDLGMGRSRNRHVARELAAALGMRYVFANSHVLLAPGDWNERSHDEPNTLALHGNAILSRFPIVSFRATPLPERTDKFEALEKRLGEKRTLICDLELPLGPITVALVHLDPFCDSRHRAHQLKRVLAELERDSADRILLGGDLNTHTEDFSGPLHATWNNVRKLVRFRGFRGTVEQYMTPEVGWERRVFDVLAGGGLEIEGFNDRSRGTLYYDANDPEIVRKALDYIPPAAVRWMRRKLEPWGGRVPMRVDWFAGRGIEPLRAEVVERPEWKGQPISDHNPIVLEIAG
jgi:endonuclease/exonuclease/phosphatase family metal-dependent hydrolase